MHCANKQLWMASTPCGTCGYENVSYLNNRQFKREYTALPNACTVCKHPSAMQCHKRTHNCQSQPTVFGHSICCAEFGTVKAVKQVRQLFGARPCPLSMTHITSVGPTVSAVRVMRSPTWVYSTALSSKLAKHCVRRLRSPVKIGKFSASCR